ncbi:MAG: MBL fold metallo-hydrolase [Dermatophilaceae bacterium]
MIRVTWVGHSTVVLDLSGVRLLTDPLLRPHAGVLRRVGLAPDAALWEGTDAILVSHLHHDHADLASLRLFPHRPVLSAGRNQVWLHGKGLTTQAVTRHWTSIGREPGEVRVRTVHAEHHSRPMPHRPNAASGFLLRSAEATVWFAGDTSVYDGMRELPALSGTPIDLALLPIHGWGPRLSDGHMGPREAASACAMADVRAVLPIHYGTLHPAGFHLFGLDWMHRPREQFAAALREISPGTRLVALDPGGSARLG